MPTIKQMVKPLPVRDKIILTKEMKKKVEESKLGQLLDSFRADNLSEEGIDRECDIVRERICRKSHG